MIQGALEADGRIAAKNAVKIRAALRELADYKQVFLQYQETHPVSTDNLAKDRARARAWAIMNLTQLRTEALASALWRMWAEAYVLGDVAAGEWIRRTEELNKADDGYVDWSKWQPGDRAAAIMLKRPKAFQQILDNTGATIRGMSTTSITDIGNALADAVELGLDAERAAVLIGRHVASPSRALTIAITEQNRVMSAATIARYKEAELEKMEWHVSDPCATCAQNASVEVIIGTSFPSGDTQPPAHPHCRCVLLPVIPGFDAEPEMPGATMITPPEPVVPAFLTPKEQVEQAVAELHAPKLINAAQVLYEQLDARSFEPGKWDILPRDAVREAAVQNLMRAYQTPISRMRAEAMLSPVAIGRADKALLTKGVVYKNGKIEVQFSSSGLQVTEAQRKAVLKKVERLQTTNPKERAVVHIEKNSSGKYGWAYGGKSDLWVTPKVVQNPALGAAEKGNFKMPVTAETSQLDYTLTHEWGHLIDDIIDGDQTYLRSSAIRKIKTEFPDAFKSGYSAKNSKEFYAEMFTEYYQTGGVTTNTLVQAMAKEFNWKVPEVIKPAGVSLSKPQAKYKNVQEWNKQELLNLSKIQDPNMIETKIWNGASKSYIDIVRRPNDPRLQALLKAQGFADTPTLVGANEFETLKTIKVYRGVTGNENLTASQMVEQFKTGDMFVGTGVVGNGVYSGSNYEYVLKYAGSDPKNVIKMGFKQDATFIDIDTASAEAKKLSDAFYDKAFGRQYSLNMSDYYDYIKSYGDISQEEAKALGAMFNDPGAYAALHGYDAIMAADSATGDSVYVILNRGAMVVEK